MDFSNTVPEKGYSIAAKPLRMTLLGSEFPTFIAGKQNNIKLSTRNRLWIAIQRRNVRIIHSPELVFFRQARQRLMHCALARASDSCSVGFRSLHLNRSIIEQHFHPRITLQIAAFFGRICSQSPEKKGFNAGSDLSPLSSDQRNATSFHAPGIAELPASSSTFGSSTGLNSTHYAPATLLPNPSSTLRDKWYRQLTCIPDRESLKVNGCTEIAVSIDIVELSGAKANTKGKCIPFGQTWLSAWNNNKMSSVWLSSKSSDDVLTTQSFSSFASSKNKILREPRFVIANQVFGKRGSSRDAHQSQARHLNIITPWAGFAILYNSQSKNKLIFISGKAGDFVPAMSAVHDREGSSRDGYSPEEIMLGSVTQRISGRSSFYHHGGRFPDLIFSESNLKASLQKDISSRAEIEKKAYHSDDLRTADRIHGFDKITAQKTDKDRPAFDLVLIADHVYTMLEKKIKMERERRGYYGL
jgi:hypothetical protein